MTERERRRVLIVGPCLMAISVAVTLVGVRRLATPARPAPPVAPLPVPAGRPLPGPTQDREPMLPPANAEGLAPEPVWILSHAELMSLTAEQKTKIQALQASFEKDTAADRQALAKASDEFIVYMQRSQAANKIDPDEVKRRNAAVGPLSARLSQVRRERWAKVLDLLDEHQRATVELARRAKPFDLR